jgi:two-component system LytT family response regulator
MKKISAVLIDDDRYSREELSRLVKKHSPGVEVMAQCADAAEGLMAIQSLSPQIVFLDIEMPGMNGFQLLEQLRQVSFEVIFITAFNQYAIKAIRFSALDYLLKPVEPAELVAAIDRYSAKKLPDSEERLQNFLLNSRTSHAHEFRLAIPSSQGTQFLPLEEISFCEAQINYTLFHLKQEKKIISSKTLKEYDELLSDHQFIRVHKSYLVNRRHIRSITAEHKLLLDGGVTVEISKRKFSEVKGLLGVA